MQFKTPLKKAVNFNTLKQFSSLLLLASDLDGLNRRNEQRRFPCQRRQHCRARPTFYVIATNQWTKLFRTPNELRNDITLVRSSI